MRGNLDEGEPHGLPGTYLNGFYETRPLPYAEAGYGYPEAGQTWSTSPTARSSGCSSTTSRSTSATASCATTSACSTSAPASCDARPTGSRRPARRSGSRSERLVSFAQRAIAAIRYEVEPLDSRGAARRPVRAGRQRAAAGHRRRRPARRRRARRRAALGVRRQSSRRHCAPCSCTAPRPAGCGWPRRWTTWSTGRTGPRPTRESQRGPRPRHDRHRARAGTDGCAWSSSSPTGGRPALGAGAARPGRGGARERAPHRLGRAGRRPSAIPRRLLGARRRRDRRRRRAPAGGPLRALPRPAGGRARRAAGDPGEGADRPRLRRAHLLGHRDLRAAGAHLHGPGCRPRRAALAARHDRPRRASARRQLGLDGAAFPWRTIRGEECSGYWPAGTAAFHINADIADAVRPLPRGDRRRGVRARRRPRAAGRDRAAVALARPPRRPRRVPDRRRHRPGRVQRDRRQQRLHQPDGAAEPAQRRPMRSSATPTRARELGVDDEEAASWRDAAEAMFVPYDEALGRPPAGRGLHRARTLGLRGDRRPSSTRCCCTSRTSTSTASRWSSRPTW